MIKKILYLTQILLLNISYSFFKLIYLKKNRNISWVIGVSEIASILNFLGNIIIKSKTVCFDKNSYYKLSYDFSIDVSNKYLKFLYRSFYGPILLGYLVNKNSHFLYIWSSGFLINREYEFKFLKSKNKKIVCMYVGDDIRSPKLTLEFAKNLSMDHFIEYVGSQTQYYLTDKYDDNKKIVAKIADKYADLIFNYKFDQISYLKSDRSIISLYV